MTPCPSGHYCDLGTGQCPVGCAADLECAQPGTCDLATHTCRASVPDAGPTHVHILISNTCVVQTQPTSLSAPLNSGLKLDFHNHSVDYEADVWSSRGYGYLQLATGGLWPDPIPHCGGPNPYVEYFDISIAGGGSSACPSVRFNISCQ